MCGKHNYKIVNKDFFKSYKVYQKQMCPFFCFCDCSWCLSLLYAAAFEPVDQF